MNPLEAETLRWLNAIRKAKDDFRRSLMSREEKEKEAAVRQDLLYFRHREEGKR